MRRLCTLTLVLILCFAVSSSVVLVDAEPSWIEWSQTYGGIEDDGALHLVYVIETSDGGYAVASNTKSFGAGNSDFWLIKTDAYGNVEWNQTYGGTDFDVAISLVQTSDGGYAVAGQTKSFGAGNFVFWLVKTDVNGNVEWNQTYGGERGGLAYSLVETSDGGFALVGSTPAFSGEGSDFWLVKTDAKGIMQWNQTYGGEKNEGAYSLVETFDGGYVLCGYTTSFGGDDADFWLVKTDTSGNMEWNKIFGGEKTDMSESVVQTSDGGYALIGTTESYGAGNHDAWLVKTGSNGNMEWNRTHGGGNSDWGHSWIVTSDGGFAFVGESDSFGAGGYDFWLVKTDELGFIEWSRTYGGPERDSAESLVQTSDGGYVLSGFTLSFGHVGSDIYLESDIWLVKTNEQGIPEFPSWIILPLFLVATLFGIIVRRKIRVL